MTNLQYGNQAKLRLKGFFLLLQLEGENPIDSSINFFEILFLQLSQLFSRLDSTNFFALSMITFHLGLCKKNTSQHLEDKNFWFIFFSSSFLPAFINLMRKIESQCFLMYF